jgi:dienelactone hydrolase
MKPARWLVCAALLAAAACNRSQPAPTTAEAPPAPSAGSQSDKAQALVKALAAEDFDAAGRDFDDVMKRALPAEKLGMIWRDLVRKAGPFREQRGMRTDRVREFDVVLVTCHFDQGDLDVRVVFNPDNRIGGLQFVPTVASKTPPYAKPDSYTESDVTVESGRWKMPGTLTLPKGSGPFPGVVLVHGSGPNDRDETLGPNKPFRDLAWGLASQGVAVLRYDKRTLVYGKSLDLQSLTLKEETVDDALAAAALLRRRPEVNPKKVFILGHSLGAMAAPQIGERDPGLAGLIVMAGASRPLEDVIVEQVSYIASLKGPLKEEDRKELDKLKKQAARVKDPALSPQTPASELLLGAPAAYLLSLRGYDPPAAAAKLSLPMLILQGGRDYQVTMADFEGWKKALAGRRNATLKTYPNVNHLFMPGQGKATPTEYLEKANNVAPEVIDEVANWIKAH